ncbi:MAG TPA: carboxypeptidase-like regulatory domain-containing protein, partial [Vicinamibacterales bacterium]|nr:carboxypeptidase-like regulatory domain-containing protein [Vicinamibacterales bacterium]
MRAKTCVVTALLLLIVSVTTARGQTFTGGIRGLVTDANGVIPGVTVTLTNQATNVSRETVTNEVGQYNFPAVPPGTYALKTQVSGYKTAERTGLVLATQQFLTIDFVLEPGSLEETITVMGESPVIDTTTASTGGTLDRLALEQLPSPGRN